MLHLLHCQVALFLSSLPPAPMLHRGLSGTWSCTAWLPAPLRRESVVAMRGPGSHPALHPHFPPPPPSYIPATKHHSPSSEHFRPSHASTLGSLCLDYLPFLGPPEVPTHPLPSKPTSTPIRGSAFVPCPPWALPAILSVLTVSPHWTCSPQWSGPRSDSCQHPQRVPAERMGSGKASRRSE